jgi:hypothetical protein
MKSLLTSIYKFMTTVVEIVRESRQDQNRRHYY